MKLLETFIQGKYADDARCEDGYVFTDDFAAVIDGSTSKRAATYGPPPTETCSGGRLAMMTVSEALRRLPADIDRHTMVTALTEALRAVWPPEAAHCAAYRPTCSAVIFSRHYREVWMIGDCQCRYEGNTYTHPKRVDALLTEIRVTLLRHLLAHGHSLEELQRRDLGRAFIYEALRDQTYFQNDPNPYNPYRYAVLDGTAVDEQQILTLPIPHEGTLILTSDGYPAVDDTWDATERHLQELLREDPLCIGPLAATKGLMEGQCSFDDRTYLSFRVEG